MKYFFNFNFNFFHAHVERSVKIVLKLRMSSLSVVQQCGTILRLLKKKTGWHSTPNKSFYALRSEIKLFHNKTSKTLFGNQLKCWNILISNVQWKYYACCEFVTQFLMVEFVFTDMKLIDVLRQEKFEKIRLRITRSVISSLLIYCDKRFFLLQTFTLRI